MRRIFRWVLGVLLVVGVLVGLLWAFKDDVARRLATDRIESETGLRAQIQRFDFGIARPTLTIEDLLLFNTKEFGGDVFLDLGRLHVEYDQGALSNGRLHLRKVEVALKELHLVKNKAGERNYQVLEKRLEGLEKKRDLDLQFEVIEKLTVSLGDFKYTDMANPDAGIQKDLGVDEVVLHDVRSEADLGKLVVTILLKHGLDWLKAGELL